MIFGDAASGKSTFAENLGQLTDIPVVHLDELMDDIGRDNHEEVAFAIQEQANRSQWIIEGNAFGDDPEYRLGLADVVYAFDFSPVRSLAGHIMRHARQRLGHEQRVGSANTELNLGYFLPYTFSTFPPRKRAAIDFAQANGKELEIFRSKQQASDYLSRLSRVY
jgi:hypothetical protein